MSYPQVSLALPLVEDKKKYEPPPITYDDAQVWRTPLQTQQDLDFFRDFQENGDISLWSLNKKRADYLVHRKNRVRVYRKLRKKGFNHSVLILDVQRRIKATPVENLPWTDASLRIGHRLNFQKYPTIQILDEYLEYVRDNYASIARVSTIGNSVENRTIKMIHISNGNPSNKAIVVLGGQHAREWISVTSALYIANNIVTKFEQQPRYMKNKDWYIIPLLNPDGYSYSQTEDRLWRKNRRLNSNMRCRGVDLNRNFPKNWQVPGVTENDQCKEDYAGPFALSEPESLALFNLLDSMGSKLPSAFVDLHSYGQMVLYPWGLKDLVSPFKILLEDTAADIVKKIFNVTGRKYEAGTPFDTLYSVSGTAIDWFHSKGVALAYSFEGRDTGTYGFLLPSDHIETSGKDMLAAVRAIAKSLEPTILMRGGYRDKWF